MCHFDPHDFLDQQREAEKSRLSKFLKELMRERKTSGISAIYEKPEKPIFEYLKNKYFVSFATLVIAILTLFVSIISLTISVIALVVK